MTKEKEYVTIKIPVNIEAKWNELFKHAKTLYAKEGKPPSLEELSIAANVEIDEARRIIKEVFTINNLWQ